MQEAITHEAQLKEMKAQDDEYVTIHKAILGDLTCDKIQFKLERINKKVSIYIEKQAAITRPRSTHRIGYELTPLLLGKIQYAKLRRDNNIEQVRKECDARGLVFNKETNWTNLIKLIKEHEKDAKFFMPRTDYNLFKWNDTHY